MQSQMPTSSCDVAKRKQLGSLLLTFKTGAEKFCTKSGAPDLGQNFFAPVLFWEGGGGGPKGKACKAYITFS